MRIVIASDSYKGSLTSLEVANAMVEGIHRVTTSIEVVRMPLADGGEGTLDAILTCLPESTVKYAIVQDPLGRPISARYLVTTEGVAVIEMAEASGLTRLKATEFAPLKTSTYGTGELIRAALDEGCRDFIIGIGGSATNDGGVGVASALGIRFLDQKGCLLPSGGGALTFLSAIDRSGLDHRLRSCRFTVLCDVDNPLFGKMGASEIYGPQKGATPEMVRMLDDALEHYAKICAEQLDSHNALLKGAGAAGGLGFGLMTFLNAVLKPGVDVILDLFDFDKVIEDTNLVITGEGQMDGQTAYGKAPIGVAQRAMKKACPVIAIVGSVGAGYEAVFEKGIQAVFSIMDKPMSLDAACKEGAQLVSKCTENVMRMWCTKR